MTACGICVQISDRDQAMLCSFMLLLEKETLGLTFGCGKFHSYVYGLPTAETDQNHSNLSEKKNLSDMSPRIQRMMMTLQRYVFEQIYTPGKDIVLVDALSRTPTSSDMPVSSRADDGDAQINMVTVSLPASDVRLQKIIQETAKDPMLQKVSHHI